MPRKNTKQIHNPFRVCGPPHRWRQECATEHKHWSIFGLSWLTDVAWWGVTRAFDGINDESSETSMIPNPVTKSRAVARSYQLKTPSLCEYATRDPSSIALKSKMSLSRDFRFQSSLSLTWSGWGSSVKVESSVQQSCQSSKSHGTYVSPSACRREQE